MKQILCLLCAGTVALSLSAQRPVAITTTKTTSLSFPFSVLHVDRGTKDVLVQLVAEKNNILLLKAATENFPETNLTVITADGSLYGFTLSYSAQPDSLQVELPVQAHASVASVATNLLDNPPAQQALRYHRWGMAFSLTGVYIKEGKLYCQFQLTNESALDFDVDVIRFYIRDRRQGKRTAVQEIEQPPVFIAGNNRQVAAHATNTLVAAFEKFTIPEGKEFIIEVGERNGGRQLHLRVHNPTLIRAHLLPSDTSAVR